MPGVLWSAAHPHVCGEHAHKGPLQPVRRGSSPRVWGAPLRGRASAWRRRLIPTCVGSTPNARPPSNRATAHPHVCGEHEGTDGTVLLGCGSSPRVWGALVEQRLRPRLERLIPTCVGSTRSAASSVSRRSAHPHVCGEHMPHAATVRAGSGSSPRVWGAHRRGVKNNREKRLIPTCVGSTWQMLFLASLRSAHPHVCGEHQVVITSVLTASGSSPRVWGARRGTIRCQPRLRLIPTCVGSTDD